MSLFLCSFVCYWLQVQFISLLNIAFMVSTLRKRSGEGFSVSQIASDFVPALHLFRNSPLCAQEVIVQVLANGIHWASGGSIAKMTLFSLSHATDVMTISKGMQASGGAS